MPRAGTRGELKKIQKAYQMLQIKGTHPYADMFPMASPEELEELTASVATVGLINPIVVTPQGLVLDGRNRLEACKRAGVEPVLVERDGDDDDYKEFVIGVNTTGRRESMTVQIAAAATALILGHDKRKNGRWVGWKNRTLQNSVKSRAESESLRCAGLVLDILGPPHLESIRDGEATLNHKYEEAKRLRDHREQEAERERRAAEEEQQAEAHAKDFFDKNKQGKQWLDSKPDGTFENMAVAHAAYLAFNREERLKEEKRRQAEQKRLKELDDGYERGAHRLRMFMSGYDQAVSLRTNADRERILAKLNDTDKTYFLEIEEKLHA